MGVFIRQMAPAPQARWSSYLAIDQAPIAAIVYFSVADCAAEAEKAAKSSARSADGLFPGRERVLSWRTNPLHLDHEFALIRPVEQFIHRSRGLLQTFDDIHAVLDLTFHEPAA